MHVMVKKWGNSASVRIPAAVMEAARLHLDETVDVREEEGRIVIEPVRPGEFELTRLLARITPKICTAKSASVRLWAKRRSDGSPLCARGRGHCVAAF